jgi:hypothetical protein
VKAIPSCFHLVKMCLCQVSLLSRCSPASCYTSLIIKYHWFNRFMWNMSVKLFESYFLQKFIHITSHYITSRHVTLPVLTDLVSIGSLKLLWWKLLCFNSCNSVSWYVDVLVYPIVMGSSSCHVVYVCCNCHVILKESRRLVLPRTSCLYVFLFYQAFLLV